MPRSSTSRRRQRPSRPRRRHLWRRRACFTSGSGAERGAPWSLRSSPSIQPRSAARLACSRRGLHRGLMKVRAPAPAGGGGSAAGAAGLRLHAWEWGACVVRVDMSLSIVIFNGSKPVHVRGRGARDTVEAPLGRPGAVLLNLRNCIRSSAGTWGRCGCSWAAYAARQVGTCEAALNRRVAVRATLGSCRRPRQRARKAAPRSRLLPSSSVSKSAASINAVVAPSCCRGPSGRSGSW